MNLPNELTDEQAKAIAKISEDHYGATCPLCGYDGLWGNANLELAGDTDVERVKRFWLRVSQALSEMD